MQAYTAHLGYITKFTLCADWEPQGLRDFQTHITKLTSWIYSYRLFVGYISNHSAYPYHRSKTSHLIPAIQTPYLGGTHHYILTFHGIKHLIPLIRFQLWTYIYGHNPVTMQCEFPCIYFQCACCMSTYKYPLTLHNIKSGMDPTIYGIYVYVHTKFICKNLHTFCASQAFNA